MAETEKAANGNGAQTALVPRQQMGFERGGGIVIRTFEELQRFCAAMVASGFFRDVHDVAQAIVKVQWGAELGIQPITAMQNIYLIDGKLSLAGALLAARVAATGTPRSTIATAYRARVVEHAVEYERDKEGRATGLKSGVCRIAWTVDGEMVGESSYTLDEARLAGLLGKKNWQGHAKWMLYWRAFAGGSRMYAPEVAFAVYTPEELNPALTIDPTSGAILDDAPEPPPAPRKRTAKSSEDALRKALEVPAVSPKVGSADSAVWQADAPAEASSAADTGATGETTSLTTSEPPQRASEPAPSATTTTDGSPSTEKKKVTGDEPVTMTVDENGDRAAGSASLVEALKTLPKDLAAMAAHCTKANLKLDEREQKILRAWARASYNESRKMAPTEAMDGATVALYREAKALAAT